MWKDVAGKLVFRKISQKCLVFVKLTNFSKMKHNCRWGRGVIQLTGPCNVGKLNFFLGKGARDRGVVDAPFPDVDFCKGA